MKRYIININDMIQEELTKLAAMDPAKRTMADRRNMGMFQSVLLNAGGRMCAEDLYGPNDPDMQLCPAALSETSRHWDISQGLLTVTNRLFINNGNKIQSHLVVVWKQKTTEFRGETTCSGIDFP